MFSTIACARARIAKPHAPAEVFYLFIYRNKSSSLPSFAAAMRNF